MKKIHTIWINVWLLMAFSVMPAGFASAADGTEDYVIALMAQIRKDPLGYAEGLGYRREILLKTLPWLPEAIYDLDPPTASEYLNRLAVVRNSGVPAAAEPVPTVNTDYAVMGDISGVISFQNFMDPGLAIHIVINNQFKKELDPLFEGKRIILSPEYKLTGVSFRADKVQLPAGPRNAYYVYACFASSLLKSEVQTVNMINQLRANPSGSYKYLSVSTGFLAGGDGPLFLNDALVSTARKSLSAPVDILAHAQYYGFSGNTVSESSVIGTFPKANSAQIALWMFSSLMVNEIRSYPARNTLLNPAWNEIGPALYHVGTPAGEQAKLTVVSGRTESRDPGVSRLYGVVFTDTDLNGVYTPGEESPDRLMEVYDMASRVKIKTAVTNRAGQFSLSLPNNAEYSIQTGGETNRRGKLVFLSKDLYLDLTVNDLMVSKK